MVRILTVFGWAMVALAGIARADTSFSVMNMSQLLTAWQTCADQGQPAGCLTPRDVRDIIGSIPNVVNSTPLDISTLTARDPVGVQVSLPGPWSALVHQNGGGACFGHMLCYGDQNIDLTADHFTITSQDPSLITYILPSGTPTAGQQPGMTWVVNGVTRTIKYTVQSGDTNLAIATAFGACLSASPGPNCVFTPTSPTLTAALLAVGAKITGANGNANLTPAPISGSDLRIPFDVPFGQSSCPTAISSANTTMTISGCTTLDNGPYMATGRFVSGHATAGDQLGGWRADGTASTASTGLDTSYVALLPHILSPNATNPQGELVIATASATSGRAAMAQMYLGNGIVTARADGSSCGYPGRGIVRTCGELIVQSGGSPTMSIVADASAPDAILTFDTITTAQQEAITFRDGGINKWSVAKNASNNLAIVDHVTPRNVLEAIPFGELRLQGTAFVISSNGDVGINSKLEVKGHMLVTQSIPSITSGFGTSPTLLGSSNAGRVTVGTGGASSGIILFDQAFAVIPVCFAQDETTSQLMRATPSLSQVIITGTMAAADKISYWCMGIG